MKTKKYYRYESSYLRIQEENGMSHIYANCIQRPCSYEDALERAKRDKKLINIIDGLRK